MLATMGVVDSILSHRPPPVLFPLLCMGNGCLLYIAPTFREIADNPMNENFRDKDFMIATFFL